MVPLQPFCALEHQAGTMDVTVEVMTYGAEDRFSQKNGCTEQFCPMISQ